MGPMMKMSFYAYRCTNCKEKIYGIENFKSHLCFEVQGVGPAHEFDRYVPQSRLLHFEMTSTQSFVNLD